MAQLDPIVNQPLLYVNGLQVSRASVTTLSIAAGGCRDSNNQMDMNLGNYLGLGSPAVSANSATTLNAAVNGINGLDSGSLANDTWYYVFVIADSSNKNPTGTILSTSRTAPVLPFGYDSIRWIDVQRTNGSAQFLLSYNYGNGNLRRKYWDAAISVLSNGTATSLTAVSLDSAVPPIDSLPVSLRVEFTPNVAGDYVGFAPFGSTAATANLVALSGSVSTVKEIAQLQVLSKLDTTAKILYINSAATGDSDVLALGFEMPI